MFEHVRDDVEHKLVAPMLVPSQALAALYGARRGACYSFARPMRRSAVLATTVAVAAALVTSVGGAASPVPNLSSATAKRGHVVVTFTLGEFAPGQILVATRAATTANGKFVTANIRLNEPLRSVKTATGYRARTRHALPAGRYYVEVSGVVVGLDCVPRNPCPQHWSNVRRVRIPRS